jgi:hypothetical protein
MMDDIAVGIYVNNKWRMTWYQKSYPRKGDEYVLQFDQGGPIKVKVTKVSKGSVDEDFLGYPICDVSAYCEVV